MARWLWRQNFHPRQHFYLNIKYQYEPEMSEVKKSWKVKLKTLQVQFAHLSDWMITAGLLIHVNGPPRGLSERWNCWSLKERKRIMLPLILMMLIIMIILICFVRRRMKKIAVCAQAVMKKNPFAHLFQPSWHMIVYQLCQKNVNYVHVEYPIT